jgi:fumarate reductase flavoprotein subunit
MNSGNLFTPGNYTATANGRGGEMVVEVKLGEKTIDAIEVKEHNETSGIYQAAFDMIPELIISHQTLAVDAVSGATLTSNGIINAVKECIAQAGGTVDSLMTPIPKENRQEILTTDVVIVGAGGAGLSAAVEAVNQGIDVILVEALGMTGGATGLSGGIVMSTATSKEAAEYKAITSEDMLIGLQNYGTEYFDPMIARAYLENTATNVEWIKEMGQKVGYELVTIYVDPFMPLKPEEPDSLGFTIPQTSMPEEVETAADGLGFWITDGLYKTAQDAGVHVYLNTRADKLLSENGSVTGIEAIDRNGVRYVIHAKSTVLACGGFGANKELCSKWNGAPGPYMGPVSNVGFGILAAEAIGAKIEYAYIPSFEDMGMPVSYNTIGGVFINEKTEVLDTKDQPIPGFYSAGEMAGIMVLDPPHFASGVNNSWAIYGGRIAGKEAALYAAP